MYLDLRFISIILFSLTMSQKISQPIIIACRLGVIFIWIIKDKGRICVDETIGLYRTLVIPRIAIFVYTLLLYVFYFLFGGTQVFLGAAISETVQQLVFIVTGCAFYKISQKNAIKDLFAAVVLNYGVTLIIALRNLGISGVVTYLKAPADALSSVTTYFEIHGLMFALGVLVIYFILFEPRDEDHHYLKIIVCLFFIYCGYKRIELVAITMAIILFIIFKRKNVHWLIFGGTMAIVIAFFYLIITSNGSMVLFLEEHNINLMGRDVLYSEARSFYELTWKFMGHGVGSTRKLLANSSVSTFVHNNILQFFIEYGCFGMIFWLGYQMIYLPWMFNKNYNYSIALFYSVVSWYLFVTYLTDNTAGYILVQNVLFIVFAYMIENGSEMMHVYDEKMNGVKEKVSNMLSRSQNRGMDT